MVWLNFSQNMYVSFVIFLMAGNMKLAPYFIYTWNVFVWLDKVYRDLSIIKKNKPKDCKKNFQYLDCLCCWVVVSSIFTLNPFFRTQRVDLSTEILSTLDFISSTFDLTLLKK